MNISHEYPMNAVTALPCYPGGNEGQRGEVLCTRSGLVKWSLQTLQVLNAVTSLLCQLPVPEELIQPLLVT